MAVAVAILALLALIFIVLAIMNVLPLWVSVLMLSIALFIQSWPALKGLGG